MGDFTRRKLSRRWRLVCSGGSPISAQVINTDDLVAGVVKIPVEDGEIPA